MDAELRQRMDDLRSEDREAQARAAGELLTAAEQPVDWAYEVWDELVAGLASSDPRLRAISAQLLCSLSVCDPEMRILAVLPALLAGTRDRKFATARRTLQALWKVGTAGPEQKQALLAGLSARFADCAGEPDYTLIRFDILIGMKKLYDVVKDERIRFLALKLIGMEEDPRYHRKYLTVWKRPDRGR